MGRELSSFAFCCRNKILLESRLKGKGFVLAYDPSSEAKASTGDRDLEMGLKQRAWRNELPGLPPLVDSLPFLFLFQAPNTHAFVRSAVIKTYQLCIFLRPSRPICSGIELSMVE